MKIFIISQSIFSFSLSTTIIFFQMFLFVYSTYQTEGGLTENEKNILDMFLSLLSFYVIFIFTNFF
jgi:hypothetical protein